MLSIDPGSHLAGLLLAVSTLTTIATAQAIIPSAPSASFPACALSCTQLIEAQNNCIPPAAPVTNQATYDSCFCQSSLLAQLRISPDGTCDAFCTVQSDRQLLQNWYKGFCASVTDTLSSSTAASALSIITSGVSTVTVLLSPTSPASSSTLPTITGTGNTVQSTSSSNNSWIDTHWRWILMLGILLIGLGVIAFLAVYLKRRHRRKVEEKRATLSGFPPRPSSGRNRTPTRSLGPELWGPHQHMAHTQGWEYTHEQDTVSEGVMLETGKKGKKIRREESQKAVSRHNSRSKGGAREADTNGPSVAPEMSQIQRRQERDQERQRERNRDQYAEYRSQSMRGAVSAFDRDRESVARSQTMREKDKAAWRDRDPEQTDTIEKL